MKTLVFVIPSLSCGGAENAISSLANHFAEKSIRVALVTFSNVEHDFFKVSSHVIRVGLDLDKPSGFFLKGLINFFKRITKLRQVFFKLKPDAIISFLPDANIISILAARGLKFPVFIAERIPPEYHKIEAFWEFLRPIYYPKAKAIFVQTKGARKWCEKFFSSNHIFTIPNAVNLALTDNSSSLVELFPEKCREGDKYISHLSRFEGFKGQEKLIEGFAKFFDGLENWKLLLIGDGNTKEACEKLAKSLGVESRVIFAGKQKNPHDLLVQSHLFVYSSSYEGFPNALLEAVSLGLPCVAFDCPFGPSDIIENGENGFLLPVDDIPGLFGVVKKLIADGELREKIACKALITRDRYAKECIYTMWEMAISKAVAL